MTTCRILLLLLLAGLSSPQLLPAEEPEARARRLINSLGCKACHSFEGSGSTLAPALDRIGVRLNMQQLREQLTTHDNRAQKPFMPDFSSVPEADMQDILQFLSRRK